MPADQEIQAIDAWWRAANYLSAGQIYLRTNPLLRRAAAARGHQAAAARPLGHLTRAELLLRPPQPRDRRPRPGHDLRDGPGPRRARRRSPTPGWRAPTARSTRTCHRTRRGWSGCSGSSPSRRHPQPRRARDARLDPRGRRARLRPRPRVRRGLRQPGPASWPASSATVRPRPARWRRAGTPTSSSTRSRDGAVLPILHLNGYKIANPTVLARIPERRARRPAGGVRAPPDHRERRRPGDMHRPMAAALDEAISEIIDRSGARRGTVSPRAVPAGR